MGPVGILALQGDVERHEAAIQALGHATQRVRGAAELDSCSALVIPGGESTTLSTLLRLRDLRDPLCRFGATHPVLGTCAGLVLMARDSGDPRVASLGLLDVRLQRNHYGSQIHSFSTALEIPALAGGPVTADFIRAPAILDTAPGVEVLASCDGLPVLVRQGRHVGASFHPELVGDARIHRLWLEAACH